MEYTVDMKIIFNKITASILVSAALLFMSAPVAAQAVTYRQEKLMLTDAEGDEVLLSLFADTCETGLKKCFSFKNVPPQASQLRTPRFVRENPILNIEDNRVIDNTQLKPLFKPQSALAHMRYIIINNKYPPSLGEMHSWAKGSFSLSKFALSKIIMALATATSPRFMYVGQEENLIAWILARPDNSVTIEGLFKTSYELNQGNVYLAILTIENVLADATFEKDREKTAVNQKLADLYEASPNKFGDWYHFFGTMLAGYANEPAQAIAELYGVYRRISRGSDAEKSTMDADKAGADIGVKLRHFVFTRDVKLQKKIHAEQQKRETLSKTSLGNLKYIGPDGNMYIGTRF